MSLHKHIVDTGFELNNIPLKQEVEFPGMWEKLAVQFIRRRKHTIMDKKTTWDDFEHICILSEGGFGKVTLSKYIKRDIFVALKVVKKCDISKSKKIHIAFNEKYILSICEFKFILKMFTAFQTNDNLVFCLELAPGGDLFGLLSQHGPFNISSARFYSGQVILGLQYLHTMKIVYRDLKPENILLAANGYLKLADMGFAKVLKSSGRTYTFCGTPEYIAPEIILNKGYGIAVDWWSFGILLYELLVSHPPFISKDHMEIYKKVVKGKYIMNPDFPNHTKNLINDLLQSNATKRIGNLRNGALDVRYHHFYKHLNWNFLMDQSIEPPFPVDNPDYSKFKKNIEVERLIDTSKIMQYEIEFSKF